MSDIFERARVLEGEGRLEEAAGEYAGLIDAGLGGSVALLRRGLLHNQLGDFPGMTADLEAAQRVDPGDPYPWMWQGHIAAQMRRPLFAHRCHAAAVHCAPPGCAAEMRICRAELLLQLGWVDEAAAMARGVPADVGDWWARTRKRALERHAECHAATRALLRARRTTPQTPETCLRLAEQLWSLGRLDLAHRLCAGLVEQRPRDWAAFGLMTRVIARREGGEAALAFLHSVRGVHAGDSNWMHGWTGAAVHLLHDLGRFEEVIAMIQAYGPRGFEELQMLAAFANVALGRVQPLVDFCRDWMLSVPESVPAGGFLITAFDRARRERRAPVPAAASNPLHLVQFWHSADVPDDVRGTMASWRRHHPELEVTLFDAPRAADLFRDAFGPTAHEAFAHCRHPAMQADIFRIAFLAHAGGLYADADELCLAPMPAVLRRAADAEMAAVRSGETPNFLHNYFMGARAGSPTLRRALGMATAVILDAARDGRPVDIWHTTGPGLITRAAGLTIAERFESMHGDDLALLPMQQYRAFTRVADDLAYKRQASANWRLN